MDSDSTLAFQTGIAGAIDEVPATMSATHDALIEQWGNKRRSAVSWFLYGSQLAFDVARARGRPIGSQPAGTLEEGWDRLEKMLAGGGAPAPVDYMTGMREFADQFPAPTLVIAVCEVRIPREQSWMSPAVNGSRSS